MAAAAETETASTAEAAAIGWRRHHQWCWRKHWDNNDGNNRQQRLQRGLGIALLSMTTTGTMTLIMTRTTVAVTTKTIMTTTVGRGAAVAVLKKELVAAAEAAEVATVAKVRADNNQKSAAKTVMAVIAVGKRRQARGEKRWRQRGWQRGPWRRRQWRRQRWPMGRGQR